ncbi:hypothetical protein FOXG_20565 [Fusarium oxysporum f. sp. lycopersici 4287]|uniref:Uncharacterized protein n=2 Tax=Fusarium oxysporum TaxID=5507 RepID=A0A0J9WR29_FUSO4|nr:hypothetical protein FOXG_20565 [Fusarium oxysporum f. sp. lycopersici 4287]EXK29997.1 hypothetical protein FOMG_13691 [Fusarium oxysporum f. sp. melonis 26406]KAJ9418621.1 hypothetical protein QL093DRAFT_1482202 [Fusarium oxysporum]KNB11812.1 hypothetical protein FOXG_20565 [Fusarium oxysporum f. sp. lycopersici 4287]
METHSSYSGVTASTKTWNSDTDSDPVFRDPTYRLQRCKSTVISVIFSLYNQGYEGRAVLQKDELLFRGYHNPVMRDRTSTPDEIEFWKDKDQYLTEELRRIELKKGKNKSPKSRMAGLVTDRIYNWITTPAEQVAHNDGPDANPERPQRLQSQTAQRDEIRGLHSQRVQRLKSRAKPGEKLPAEQGMHGQTSERGTVPTSYIASPCQTIEPERLRQDNRRVEQLKPGAKQMSPPATSRLLRSNVSDVRCKKPALSPRHEARRSRRLAKKTAEYGMLIN